ncbi:MAG: QueT transporter family protein [Oscillospiraceae bacterium]|jgi:uncharacterized membrane protein|nr:QueT transporter family protein [Oscillospiraceae bacterium]
MKSKTKFIAINGIVAALYCTLTLSLGDVGFMSLQFRPAEAMTVLPFISPYTVWGLFAGCLLSNIISPLGVLDMVFGSAATLLAGCLTARCKSLWTAVIPPIAVNAVVVGALIVVASPELGGFVAWPAQAGMIAVSQTISCAGLGAALYYSLKKLSLKERLN